MRGGERFAMLLFYGVFILLLETVICGKCNNGDQRYPRSEPEYENNNPGYYNNPGGGQPWSSSASSSVISSGYANAVGTNSYVYNPESQSNSGSSSQAYAFSSSKGNIGVNTYASAPSTGSTSAGSKSFVYVVPPPRPNQNREFHQSNTGRGEYRCNGDRNATFKSCPDPCPGTCRNPQGVDLCYAMCVPHGCECNPGYVLSDEGICILYRDCPGVLCNGDRNATYKACPDPCPSTCELLGKTRMCARKCKPYGCECNSGYHLNAEGKCVYVQDCPGALCKGDKNATYVECPNPCPETCDNPAGPEVCTAVCLKHGCQCNEGYYLNRCGKCVALKDCPGCNGDRNATYSDCPSICPKTCDDPKGPEACADVCGDPGCVCKEGYYLNSDGKCVSLEDCPVCNPNATYKECRSACPKTCDDPKGPEVCLAVCKEPGCECDEGYYLTPCGKCVLLADCPGCKGDYNATFSECPSICPKTCDDPKGPDACADVCGHPGCVCKERYYLNSDGKCVLLEDCAVCNPNATYKECRSACPKTCDDPKGPEVCTDDCKEPGCECDEGYYLTPCGKCVLLEDCPGCKGDSNATFSECPSICPKTCDDPKGPDACAAVCGDPGCVCKEGYYLNSDGKCVSLEDCPVSGCKGDPNATYKTCPNPCPKTCKLPSGQEICNKACLAYGCECNQGYYLNDEGKCVKLQDCPGAKLCTSNETFVFCKAGCPTDYCPVDDNRGIVACDPPLFCNSGCVCKGDYLRLSYEDDTCILATECPPVNCTRPNEEWSTCPPACLKESCSDLSSNYECDSRFFYCRPRCVCKSGFYRNDSDICVPENECAPSECGYNEIPVECKTICPPQFCNISYTDYFCTDDIKCEPGCDCLPNHLRNDSGICIFNEDCPPPPTLPTCGENEFPTACSIQCPPQTCDSIFTTYNCENQTCVPGCDCIDEYLRNSEGVCIPSEECFSVPTLPTCGENEIASTCSIQCPPQTCDSIFAGVYKCENQTCVLGCDCIDEYLRNSEGVCIPSEECFSAPSECGYNEIPVECKTICPPQFCNISYTDYFCTDDINCEPGCDCLPNHLRNDSGICIFNEDCPPPPTLPTCGENEFPTACSIQCPPQTCDSIFTTYNCENQTCVPGCDCIDEYLRNSEGVCIPSEECFSAPSECGYNEMPVKCKTVCPPQFCNISYTDYFCTDDIKCEPGCDCLPNHLRNDSGICIFNEDCPPPPTLPTCGENEFPTACSIQCPPQTCDSIFTTYNCENQTCVPGCDCIDEYLRNSEGVCIPSEECFSEPGCDVPPSCRPTCYNPRPNSDKCPSVNPPTENQNGCKCKDGYILTSAKGECIKYSECPGSEGCNGDPNAIITECPWSCPSTCNSPKASSCGKPCAKVGCQCRSGLILSEEKGKCILPEDCPYGNPCGENGTFADCSFRCPNQYCPEDDSRAIYACKPGRPCPSGCMCKDYYKRASKDDDTCVLARDCAAINCTRSNEEYNPCTNSCLSEDCTDIGLENNCEADTEECIPKCVCIEGFYRDVNGDCIPKSNCPNQCDVDQKCRSTCAVPNPPYCEHIPPSETNNECNCQRGYILDKVGGKCIKIEDCPADQSCNDDPNAQVKACPRPCPSTCEAPDAFPCKRKCMDVGCECRDGYLFSKDGQCVLPDQCEGGNPCGENATFVPCRYICPTNFCPVDDSRDVVVCENTDCFSGCVCRLNYRRLSVEDPRCIVSTDCPPINCTRDYEEFNPCPSDCSSGYCEDEGKGPIICNTLVLNCNPQCTCIKDYYRSPFTNVCVSSAECRKINKKNKKKEN